jgi:hypothetical protein
MAFDNELDHDVDNIEIEEDDCVIMAIVHSVDHFICSSSTVSRCLAEAFAKSSKPKGFYETMPIALHTYEDVFNKMAFDMLP